MPNDTNPDIVDKADAIVGIAEVLESYDPRYSPTAFLYSLAGAMRLYACAHHGHRSQWGAIASTQSTQDRHWLYNRTCQRCGRNLQPAERPKE